MELKKKKIPKILYFIQLPPPVHGVSVINKQVYDSIIINKEFSKELLQIRFSSRFDQIRRLNILKIGIFLKLCLSLIYKTLIFNPDLIYFSFMPVGKGFYRDAFFLAIIKLFGKKVILHFHNRGIKQQSRLKLRRYIYSKIFSNTNIIHLSERIIKEEFSNLKFIGTKLFVAANGIEVHTQSICKINKNKKNLNLLYLSNLMEEKGIFDLLFVFNDLINIYPNLQLNIIGASFRNNDEKLMSIINADLNLSNKVSYFGPLYGEDKMKILENTDIFVFPSYFSEECMPLVILEAMQFGLPIICTDIGAISEVLTDKSNAILYSPKDNIALKKALELIISDQKMRTILGENAKSDFNKFYTIEKFEKRMFDILTEITWS